MATMEDSVGMTFMNDEERRRRILSRKLAWQVHVGHGESLSYLDLDGFFRFYRSAERDGSLGMHYLTNTACDVWYGGHHENWPCSATRLRYKVPSTGRFSDILAYVPEAEVAGMYEGWYRMQIAVYAEKLHAFRSKEDLGKYKHKIPAECFVPVYTKPDDPVCPSALTDKAVVAGYVEAFELRTNTVTDIPYYWAKVRSRGLLLDVLAAGDKMPPDEMHVGDILMMMAYKTTARPLRRLGDEDGPGEDE